MDSMPILLSAIVSSIAGSIEIGKKFKEWANGKNDPEAKQMASDFLSSLLEIQTDFLNLQSEFIRLSGELGILKKNVECRSKLVRRNGYYIFDKPVEGYGQGPFCLVCTDKTGIPVGIVERSDGHLSCASCGSSGWIEGTEPPDSPPIRISARLR